MPSRGHIFTSAGRLASIVFMLALSLAASCTTAPKIPTPLPQTAFPLAPKSTPTNPPLLHAPEIRFALIGDVSSPNAWALFDADGYSYNNYAVHASYWPRLYQLSVPDGQFEPLAARAMPSPIEADGALFSASVPLRTDITWTDGSPFTADDVAFTVNTALSFELGFDWHAYYDRDWLDHAAAIDSHTVKFYFKRSPSVAMWQYSALQGPVLQKNYWAPRIEAAAALLPSDTALAMIPSLKQNAAVMQQRVDAILGELATAADEQQIRQLQGALMRQQSNLDEANNDLSKAQAIVDVGLQAARQALYSIDAQAEPTLGTWVPAGAQNGTWSNAANPARPFGSPDFDRALYISYPDQAAAIAALQQGQVDGILDPHGVPAQLKGQLSAQEALTPNSTSSAYFLVINPAQAALADPPLRRALFCSMDPALLPGAGLNAISFASFVAPGNAFWSNPQAQITCGDPSKPFDLQRAVAILKAAGYTWASEPAGEKAGLGLKMPDGQPFPSVTLLTPAAAADPQSNQAGLFVQQSVRYLGIPLSVQSVDPADVRYALFQDGGYDIALAGWRLSTYPGYLCDWFGDGNPFGYNQEQIRALCQVLASTSDLAAAQGLVVQIESLLAQDLSFIPVYDKLIYDVTRSIHYPFQGNLDGLSGIYGAPGVALPGAP